MWSPGETLDRGEHGRRHSELAQRDRASAVIQEAQHHALPIHRRYGRDTKIQLARLETHANAAVLWAPPLSDVQLRKQLDARHDRLVHTARRFGGWHEHAIEAVSRGQAGSCGLEMDIGRASVERVAHEKIHVPHDRSLVGEVANVRGEIVVGIGACARKLDRPLGAGRDALDQPFQLTAIDALDAHLLAVCECQVVESIEERVWCRRDDERTVRRPLARAQAMVCEVLARQSVGE